MATTVKRVPCTFTSTTLSSSIWTTTTRRKRKFELQRCFTTIASSEPTHKSYERQMSKKKELSPPVISAPFASMPNSMLLRSFFISFISSHRILLNPSLSFLTFLCKPQRSKGFLFNVDRNPLLHYILKRTFYDQFCAGENEKQTTACVRGLKSLGFRGVMLTYAKETVFDHKSGKGHAVGDAMEMGKGVESVEGFDQGIESWRVGTLRTVDLIGEGDYLAIKTTGAGLKVTDAFSSASLPPQQMLDALDEIATKCKARGVRIIVDAESQHFQHGIALTTLSLMRKFNRDGYAVIYNTYQCYLKSTPSLIASHLDAASTDNFTLGLKLVRGAYMSSDDRTLIHDTKADTDNAYDTFALGALKQQIGIYGSTAPFPSVNLFLASHNRSSVLAARKLHLERTEAGLPTVPVGFGQLHGMSDNVSLELVQAKDGLGGSPDVYKCSTWGSMGECLAYLTRRAVENRDAVGRTGDEMVALRREVWRRIFGRRREREVLH